ncbi:putative reverse transcriptase domain-containing protein [Tanacetum coccineum]
MASMNTRLNIEKLDENIVQKHGGSKQVGFKQLDPGVETGVHGVHDEKRVWFEVELQGAQGDREAEVFQVSNDDTAVAQRRLGDKQPEEKTNTDCLVKEQEKVHLGIKVGANITVTGVPGQEGAEGNVAGKKKVKESMKANLGKLLKYNAWSTSREIAGSAGGMERRFLNTPGVVASTVKEGVIPSVVDMMVEEEKISSLEDTTVPESFPTLTTPAQEANAPAGNSPGKTSYATATGEPSGKKVNVHTLYTPGGNGIDVVVPVDSIRAISERFANTTYGFFLRKKVAYPVVANYVRNTWGKYGLVRSMFSSSTGLFSFQFSSIDGLDVMLENGLWFIRNNPLILKKWHPDENLLKEDVSIVPDWVELHGVPVTAFSEDGLSVIATKLGTPVMLDSYTSDMFMQSWGRSSYARVMIELRADLELKDNIVVAMPKITMEGHYTCNVRVEYEWKPPMCSFFVNGF